MLCLGRFLGGLSPAPIGSRPTKVLVNGAPFRVPCGGREGVSGTTAREGEI